MSRPFTPSRMCHYCAEVPGTTKDHIVPKEWGGGRGLNLIPACSRCNNGKDNDPPSCSCTRCVRAVRHWLEGVVSGTMGRGTPKQRRRRVALLIENYPQLGPDLGPALAAVVGLPHLAAKKWKRPVPPVGVGSILMDEHKTEGE